MKVYKLIWMNPDDKKPNAIAFAEDTPENVIEDTIKELQNKYYATLVDWYLD